MDFVIAGLYKILEQVGNAYRLDLLDSIYIHLIFSPDKLQKASNNPLPGQKQDPPPPIEVNRDSEWEVETILASRKFQNILKYQVSWRGYNLDPT